MTMTMTCDVIGSVCDLAPICCLLMFFSHRKHDDSAFCDAAQSRHRVICGDLRPWWPTELMTQMTRAQYPQLFMNVAFYYVFTQRCPRIHFLWPVAKFPTRPADHKQNILTDPIWPTHDDAKTCISKYDINTLHVL